MRGVTISERYRDDIKHTALLVCRHEAMPLAIYRWIGDHAHKSFGKYWRSEIAA